VVNDIPTPTTAVSVVNLLRLAAHLMIVDWRWEGALLLRLTAHSAVVVMSVSCGGGGVIFPPPPQLNYHHRN